MHLAARTPEHYEFGPFLMDVEECELRSDGQSIPLPGKAFELLLVLVRRAGRTVGKAELLNALWPGTIVEESNLTQTVFLLRRTLAEAGGEAVYIETVPRRGYKFVAPLVELVPKPEPAQESPLVTVPPGALNPGSRSYGWIWPAATLFSLLIAAGALWGWLRQPAGVDLSKYRYQPFAYSDEPEWGGAWSPDGKNIAFIRGGDTHFTGGKLMVQPFDSTRAVQVLEKAAYPLAWSADGTRIFYFEGDGVYVVSRAGGQPERILAGVQMFDVSRDGKTMAVWKVARNGNGVRASVWISSPEGAEPQEYQPAPFATQGARSNEYLRFSPNGKLLYLSRFSENTTREAWLLPFPPGSGAPRRLFRNDSGFIPGAASWMPDNRHMVIANKLSLWLVDTRTESMTRLDDGTNWQNDPAVSPDGKHLLVSRWTPSADLFELPLDGSPPRKLLASTLAEFDPSWSRKGDQFAFLRERNDFRELWVHSSQGEWDRPIVTLRDLSEGGLVAAPDISPDGTRVAYRVTFNQRGGIYVSPLAGGTPTLLVPNAVSGASWSPDGASLVFVWTKPNGALALATLRLGANRPEEIPDLPASCWTDPVWSPSGEWIACGTQSGRNGPLSVTPLLVSPDGNRKRLLKPINAFMLAWGADSRTLYGLDWRSGRLILSAEDIASGAVRNVDYGPGLNVYLGRTSVGRMSLSPDGKSFAVGLSKGPSIQSDLWLLDGFTKYAFCRFRVITYKAVSFVRVARLTGIRQILALFP